MSDDLFVDFLTKFFPDSGPTLDLESGDYLMALWGELDVLDRPIYIVIDDDLPAADDDGRPICFARFLGYEPFIEVHPVIEEQILREIPQGFRPVYLSHEEWSDRFLPLLEQEITASEDGEEKTAARQLLTDTVILYVD